MNTSCLHMNQLADYGESEHKLKDVVNDINRLWFPSVDLTCFNLPKLAAPRAKWAEIIAWQLEDLLLGEPADYHIVWHTNSIDGSLDVSVVDKGIMRDWCQKARGMAIRPTLMVADYFALELNPQGWSAYLNDAESIIVRTSQAQGFTVPRTFFWPLVQRELLQNSDFSLIVRAPASFSFPDGGEFDEDESGGIVKAIDTGRISFSEHQIDWSISEPPIHNNLLTDELNDKEPNAGFKFWRSTLLLFGLVLGLCYVFLWVANGHYKKSATLLNSAVNHDYQQTFGRALANKNLVSTQHLNQSVDLSYVNKKSVDRLFESSQHVALQRVEQLISMCGECLIKTLKLDAQQLTFSVSGPEHLRDYIKNTFKSDGDRVFKAEASSSSDNLMKGYPLTLNVEWSIND